MTERATLTHLPIAKLAPDPDNVRREVGDVTELAASIAAQGILEPLLVIPAERGTHLVVCGHRRLEAARVAGLAEAPCIVRDLDAAGRLEAQVTENLQRSDLSPIEEARAYRRLVDLGTSQRKLVTRVGRSQSHVSKRLKLLELPSEIQGYVDAGELSVGDGVVLAKLVECPERMAKAIELAVDYRWTMATAVDKQLELHRDEVRRAEVVAELTAAGERVVEHPRYGWYGHKHRPLEAYYWNDKPPTRAKVRKDGHLAAAVDSAGEITWVCTAPANYERKAKSSGGDTGAEQRQRAERRALLADKRAAAKARQKHEAAVLANGFCRTTAARRLVASVVLDALEGSRARDACQRLGLEPPTNSWGQPDHRRALRDHAAGDEERLLRSALALAISNVERHLAVADEWEPKPEILALYDLIEADGYQPTPYEARLLGTDLVTPLVDAVDGDEPAPAGATS